MWCCCRWFYPSIWLRPSWGWTIWRHKGRWVCALFHRKGYLTVMDGVLTPHASGRANRDAISPVARGWGLNPVDFCEFWRGKLGGFSNIPRFVGFGQLLKWGQEKCRTPENPPHDSQPNPLQVKSAAKSAAKSDAISAAKSAVKSAAKSAAKSSRKSATPERPLTPKSIWPPFCVPSPWLTLKTLSVQRKSDSDTERAKETPARCRLCNFLAFGPTALRKCGAQRCTSIWRSVFKETSVVSGWVCQSNVERWGCLPCWKGALVGLEGAALAGPWEHPEFFVIAKEGWDRQCLILPPLLKLHVCAEVGSKFFGGLSCEWQHCSEWGWEWRREREKKKRECRRFWGGKISCAFAFRQLWLRELCLWGRPLCKLTL